MSDQDVSSVDTPSAAVSHDDYESDAHTESSSPETRSSSGVTLFRRPKLMDIFRSAAINLFLPFVNGLMLGFGELFAHEFAFRLGWGGTRVRPASETRHIA
jgi:hypothetical protein